MSGLPAGAGALLGKRLGKYEILALLALGGTAEIYLARIGGSHGFEKYVVVKCLHDHLADDPEFVKMFLDEARLAAVLDHSNIVQTFELGEHEHRYYMVMEYLAGLSLAMIVRRAAERLPGGKIPVPLILNIAAQACAGLHYAHERQAGGRPLNMVHRDISPQNLVVSFEGVVKVVDFGIARAEMRETKTKAGTIKGKFAYMSPEQCVATNVDRRTDVFALGVIVWELLTGRRLFKRNSPYETYQAVIECAVDAPSRLNHELDPGLDAVVMKAIAKDKTERYESAEAFGDALLGYLHHRGKSSGPADVGRFLDEQFTQELEEHGERMRELIGSRDISLDAGVGWDDEDEDKKGAQTVDLAGSEKSVSLHTADMLPAGTGGTGDSSLDAVVSDLGGGGGDDDVPAEKTRIESNPLDRIKELEESIAKAKPGTPVPPGSVTNGPAPLPAPPTRSLHPTPPAGGKFPQLANLPTQLSDSSASPPPSPTPGRPPTMPPELAPTALGQPLQPQMQKTMIAEGAAPPPGPPQRDSLYPVVTGGRPFSSDLAPSTMPPPQRSPYAGASVPSPSHAANVMSPVGDHYPQQVDWAAAAAQPAKAIPPWMLAVLFVGAIGIALTLTIVIAKIIR
jgi:serine/threonine-protein kinase